LTHRADNFQPAMQNRNALACIQYIHKASAGLLFLTAG